MNRRTLFARLSAIALAPLAKLLPREESPIPWRTHKITRKYATSMCVTTSDGVWLCDKNGNWWQMPPVPQEEA